MLLRCSSPLGSWSRLAALVCIVVACTLRGELPSRDSGEVAPWLGLPPGIALPFSENELLNEEAKARLEKYSGSVKARAATLLSQGLVGQAIDELVAAHEQALAAGGKVTELLLPLAVAYQQAGRFAEALALVNSLPDDERLKEKDFALNLENAKKEVTEKILPVAEHLRYTPKDARAWAELSRLWLSPGLQVRRNALAAASAALGFDAESVPAREAMAEALAAYAFTEWTRRHPIQAWAWGHRQGINRPPTAVYNRLLNLIEDYAAKGSMVAKLRDLYLLAAQPPGWQFEGARLEQDLINRTPPLKDPRYNGYVSAVALLNAENSLESWEHYQALDKNPETQHYFGPLKIAARPVQLVLFDLCKPKLDDQLEAFKAIPELALPKPGDYVFWGGWRWLARGIASSRTAMALLPPDAVGAALSRIEKAQQEHEMDGALLGAIGEAWFAACRFYSKDEYKRQREEFLVRSLGALDAAAEAGISIEDAVVRASALRAARKYDRAQDSILKLADPPSLPSAPSVKDKELAAVRWLKLAFLYLDHRPTEDFSRIAENCIERARKLLDDSSPNRNALFAKCRALAGAYPREGISIFESEHLLLQLPPFGAELYVRLCEKDTQLSYLELIRLQTLTVDAPTPASLVTDPVFHAEVALPIFATQIESLVKSPEGFPIVNGYQYEVESRTRKAFSSQTDFLKATQEATQDPKALSKRAGLKGIEARALEAQLAESRPALFDTLNALHAAMAKGAVRKQFEKHHGNTTVSGVLHANFRLKDFEGNERREKPVIWAQTTWEDFVFSLAVGYLHWAADRDSLEPTVLGLDDLKQQVREASPLRPDRADELTVAANRFEDKMKVLRTELLARLDREEAARKADAEREAAEDARRRAEWQKNPVVGGLDFSVTEEKRFEYTPAPEQPKVNPIVPCDICGGKGYTRTQTSYSNAGMVSCWRCKGKGTRSLYD